MAAAVLGMAQMAAEAVASREQMRLTQQLREEEMKYRSFEMEWKEKDYRLVFLLFSLSLSLSHSLTLSHSHSHSHSLSLARSLARSPPPPTSHSTSTSLFHYLTLYLSPPRLPAAMHARTMVSSSGLQCRHSPFHTAAFHRVYQGDPRRMSHAPCPPSPHARKLGKVTRHAGSQVEALGDAPVAG